MRTIPKLIGGCLATVLLLFSGCYEEGEGALLDNFEPEPTRLDAEMQGLMLEECGRNSAACLQSGFSDGECTERLNECLFVAMGDVPRDDDGGLGGWDPSDPRCPLSWDQCLRVHGACSDSTEDPGLCRAAMEHCHPESPPQVHSCVARFEECLFESHDPWRCEEMLTRCGRPVFGSRRSRRRYVDCYQECDLSGIPYEVCHDYLPYDPFECDYDPYYPESPYYPGSWDGGVGFGDDGSVYVDDGSVDYPLDAGVPYDDSFDGGSVPLI